MSTVHITSIVEEVVYGSCIQNLLTAHYGRWILFLVVDLKFTLGYLITALPISTLFKISIAFSWITDGTGFIHTGILSHISLDAIAFANFYSSLVISDLHFVDFHCIHDLSWVSIITKKRNI